MNTEMAKTECSYRMFMVLLAVVSITMLAMSSGTLLDSALVNAVSIESMKLSSDANSPLLHRPRTLWGRCRALHALGRYYLLRGWYTEAIEELQEAVLCDERPLAWFDLGRAQHHAGSVEDAAHSWRMADAFDYAVELAKATETEGDRERAIGAWEFASSIAPEKPFPYLAMARLLRSSDLARAEQMFRCAIEVDPTYAPAYAELGDLYLYEMQDLQRAQVYYRLALDHAPDDVSILARAARNAGRLGERSQAVQYWQRIATLYDKYRALAYHNLGKLALAEGNIDSALDYHRKALELGPDHPMFLTGLAHFYEEVGCVSEAIAVYRRILDLDAAPYYETAARRKLDELSSSRTDDDSDCQISGE